MLSGVQEHDGSWEGTILAPVDHDVQIPSLLPDSGSEVRTREVWSLSMLAAFLSQNRSYKSLQCQGRHYFGERILSLPA